MFPQSYYQKHVVSYNPPSPPTWFLYFIFLFVLKNVFFSWLCLVIALHCAGFPDFHSGIIFMATCVGRLSQRSAPPLLVQCSPCANPHRRLLLSLSKVTLISLEINRKIKAPQYTKDTECPFMQFHV